MSMLDISIKVYGLLLRLYPRSFRSEFGEQMLLDFTDMAADANKGGTYSMFRFCLHEFFEFPINLLRIHLKDGRMLKIFLSQPVNYGLRGAVGFAMTFFIVAILDDFIYRKIDSSSDAIIGFLFDVFHTARGPQFVSLLSVFSSVLVTGLLFGIMMALLFADRSRYPRYIVVGMLGWFLPYGVTSVLVETFNMDFYLGSKHAGYLMNLMWILSSSFLGLLFVVARSDKKEPYYYFIVGAFAYPLLLYFYIQLLFRIGLIETPRMFIALTVLVIIYLGTVLILAIKSEETPKIPWMFFVFAFGYFLLSYVTSFIYWQFFPSLQASPLGDYTEAQRWQETFLMATRAGIFEIPLGIFVGIALAFQKKNNPIKLQSTVNYYRVGKRS